MILVCPYCGHKLPDALSNGIASCRKCFRIFDSSYRHRMLSAAWMLRKEPSLCEERLVQQYGYTDDEAKLVVSYVVDGCYSPQEFGEFLKEQKVA